MSLTRPLLIVAALTVAVFACTPRAIALFPLMINGAQHWAWTEAEMETLNEEIGALRKDRDAWKHIAEKERVCI